MTPLTTNDLSCQQLVAGEIRETNNSPVSLKMSVKNETKRKKPAEKLSHYR